MNGFNFYVVTYHAIYFNFFQEPHSDSWVYYWLSHCFLFQDFCYDHMTLQSLQICFLFSH